MPHCAGQKQTDFGANYLCPGINAQFEGLMIDLPLLLYGPTHTSPARVGSCPANLRPLLWRGRFFGKFCMSLRHSRSRHSHLLQTYAEEAARLRKLAGSVTTAPLRFRLLEEADNQERLA